MFQTFLLFKQTQRQRMRNQCRILYINNLYYHSGIWRVIKLALNALNYYYLLNMQYLNILTFVTISFQWVLCYLPEAITITNTHTARLLSFIKDFDTFVTLSPAPDFSEKILFHALLARMMSLHFINWAALPYYTPVLQSGGYASYLQYLAQRLNNYMRTRMPMWIRTPRWLKKFNRKKYKNYTKIYRIYSTARYAIFQRCLLKRVMSVDTGKLHIKYACILNSITTGAWNSTFYILIAIYMYRNTIFAPTESALYFYYRKKNTTTGCLYMVFADYKFILFITCVQSCYIDKNLFSCSFQTTHQNIFFALWRFFVNYYYWYATHGASICLRFKSKYFLLAPITDHLIQLWVGYSHLTFVASSLIFFKKVGQYLLMFYSRDSLLLMCVARTYRNLKSYNCYTMRGIRMSRDKFQRRLGKIKRFL